MSDTITSSTSGVSELSQTLLTELESYTGLTLKEIGSEGNASALGAHDGMSTTVSSALLEWKDLIISDEASLQQIQANFVEVDQAAVRQILGVGAK